MAINLKHNNETKYPITKAELVIYDDNQTIGGKVREIDTKISDLVNVLYPVGSIYITTQATNPSQYWGGTWVQIKDRFLLACGDNYSNGATGGEATHTLTEAEMPRHRHNDIMLVGANDYKIGWGGGSSAGLRVDATNGWGASTSTSGSNSWQTGYTGGSQAHNNMPPYLAVYMWKRTK